MINLIVSFAAFYIIRLDKNRAVSAGAGCGTHAAASSKVSGYDKGTRNAVLVAYGLSGFVAMAYEIIWTRVLQIQVGTSIYAFSIMLTLYLAGVGIGSIFGGRFVEKHRNALSIFAYSQIFIAFYSIFGIYMLAGWRPSADVLSGDFRFISMLVRPSLVIFPVTFFLGVIFPAVSRIYVRDEAESGRGVGRIYAVNTVGCILGSLVCGFIFIWLLGTRWTIIVLSAVNLMIGFSMLYRQFTGRKAASTRSYAAAGALILLLAALFSPDPFKASIENLLHGPSGMENPGGKIYFHNEDTAATTTVVSITGQPTGKVLLINGIGVTGLCTETKLMAHLPLLLHRSPEDMLVICFGMGSTVRSAYLHKGLKIDIAELVPDAYKCIGYFHEDGPRIMKDPRIEPHVDDGRNFLLLSDKRYDVITIDPSPPICSSGTVNLYTSDFFKLCRDHLKDDGIMCLWLPPAPYSEGRMIVRSFYEVFPNVHIYKGVRYPGLYLIGFKDFQGIKTGRFFEADMDGAIVADLNEYEDMVPTPGSIPDLLVLRPEQVAVFVDGAKPVTDDKPYTEFPIWRSFFDKTYLWRLDGNGLKAWRDTVFGQKD